MAEEMQRNDIPYGVVCFTEGTFEGSLGYYDDDYDDDEVIIYLGAPLVSDQVIVPLDYIRPATPEEQIEFEMSHTAEIDPELRRRMGI